MAKTLLFLGSSSAAKSQAKAVAASLASDSVEFLPWWEAFPAGRTLLEQLDSIRPKVAGAVLVFSPESEGTVRGKAVQMPNLNVLFEFGYLSGHFGRERVALLKYGEFYLPSDLGGYIHIAGSRFFKRGAVVKIGKRTKNEFGRWFDAAGFQPSKEEREAAERRAVTAAAEMQARAEDARRFRAKRGYTGGGGSWMA